MLLHAILHATIETHHLQLQHTLANLQLLLLLFFFAAGYVMAQDTVSLRNSFYTAFCFPIARHNIFPQKVLKSLLSVLYMLNKHDALENV